MYDAPDVGPGPVDLAVDETFGVSTPILVVVNHTIEIHLQNVIRRYQGGGNHPRDMEAAGIRRVSRTNVPETIQNAFVEKDVIRQDKVL